MNDRLRKLLRATNRPLKHIAAEAGVEYYKVWYFVKNERAVIGLDDGMKLLEVMESEG